ncbi:2OG-Fe(II) oxygenase [Tahibacter caeni]|uniref:2OG-Fe(II) oxygenase n=1 Tax=Tahibacter caeni TaxID=1453545 RepID=UPI0021481C8C|nr:2OG-Fe(II) oxygenase [Tahibacter caeni]
MPTPAPASSPPAAGTPAQRVAALDWPRLQAELDAEGHAVIPQLLPAEDCTALARSYADANRFRRRVIMARHGFGRGEYQYFEYPLPPLVQTLREAFYAALAPLANRWQAALDLPARFPDTQAEFLARCEAAGQSQPTPLLLRYGAGDYNCLHQDLYGEHVFPLQAAVLLSQPGRDFDGGEFVLTERRPRLQSRVAVVPLQQGDAVVFAVNQRPVQGQRGIARAELRHGVSRLRAGRRFTLGLIFHDAS